MKKGWGALRRFRRAAVALVALTLLPVAVAVASAHAGTALAPTASAAGLAAQDVNLPYVEALQRSQASGLFAPFTWNGHSVTGPFVTFGFSPETGQIVGLFAVNNSEVEPLLDAVDVVGFNESTSPQVAGSTFVANGVGVTLVAHDEPTALLEIQTWGEARTVRFGFPTNTTDLQVSQAMSWPRAGLSFRVGDADGRIIVGRGTLSVIGTTVTASLAADDYLAFRAVPAFAGYAAEQNAILDAFASGRLAAECDLVAMTNGGWLENAVRYQPALTMSGSGIGFGRATVTLSSSEGQDGLVLLAFDPQTMPADAGHQIVVRDNGAAVPETANPLASLYASAGAPEQASFAQLPMNATVLVLYLPSLGASSVTVESVPLAPTGLDTGTELAMVAAVFVVSMAAAVMFRSRPQ